MGAFWGSLAALAIGTSELFGRRIVNVSGALTAASIMQVFGVGAALCSLLFVSSEFAWIDIGWGALSGVGLAVGLGCYFGGLRRSASTIIAPTVATLSAVIPYAYTLLRGSQASTLAIAGAVVAFAGLAMVAGGVVELADVREGFRWAGMSGLGYGLGLSVFVEASDASGAWPAVSQRVVGSLLLGGAAVVAGSALWPPEGQRVNGLLAGILTGLTSVFALVGFTIDPPSTVVTTSMFPVVSVVVGFVYFGDGIVRRQVVGIGLALLGIAAVVTG